MRHSLLVLAFMVGGCTPGPVVEWGKTAGEPLSFFSTVPGGANVVIDPACSGYKWKDRGRAPIGYLTGLALTQMRGESRAAHGSILGMNLGSPDKDTLAHYKPGLDAAGIPLTTAQDRAAATYLILAGLGMRESSGNYLEGWDESASGLKESTAETGLFQVSYGSMPKHDEIAKIYDEYRADISGCMLTQFEPGTKAQTGKNTKPLGTGAGRDFQIFTKACPAFATEYAALALRLNGGLKGEWGPIRRKEVEIQKHCYQ